MTRLGLFSRQRTQAQEQATPLPDQPDPTMPSPKRQKQLEHAYTANVAAENAPYDNIHIATLGELLWILEKRGWPTAAPTSDNTEDNGARPNADLRDADLQQVNLDGAWLTGADLRGTRFNGASLLGAKLDSTLLVDADFTDTRLLSTKDETRLQQTLAPTTRQELLRLIELLRKAALAAKDSIVSLRGVDLSAVDLDGLDLTKLDLSGARLISEIREAELRSAIQENIDKSLPPCQDATMTRLNEVLWVRQEQERLRMSKLDLRGAKMNNAKLANSKFPSARMDGIELELADLRISNLSGAELAYADLRKANISDSYLVAAILHHASLTSGLLIDTNLTAADLTDADISFSNVTRAELKGAKLFGTNLSYAMACGADLRGTRMSTTTQLFKTIFNSRTLLGNVTWGGTQLTAIDWTQVEPLGEEKIINELKSRSLSNTPSSDKDQLPSDQRGTKKQRIRDAYENAIQAYSALQWALHEQGKNRVAARFRLRALYLKRAEAWSGKDFLRWLPLEIVALTTGFGERLWRLFHTYSIVLAFFTLLYAFFAPGASFGGSIPSQLANAAVQSLLVFHGLGFARQIAPGSPGVIYIAAIFEALVGFILQGVFIAALTRRLMGS